MAQLQVYEGTAEEIAEQIRGSKLPGNLRAIVTLDEDEVSTANGTGETLDKALAALLEEADHIEREPSPPPKDPRKKVFGEIVDEKYRKMGFKV